MFFCLTSIPALLCEFFFFLLFFRQSLFLDEPFRAQKARPSGRSASCSGQGSLLQLSQPTAAMTALCVVCPSSFLLLACSPSPPQPAVDVPARIALLTSHASTLQKASEMHEKRAEAALARAVAKKRVGDTKGALLEMKKRKLALAQVEKLSNMIMTSDALSSGLQTMQLNSAHLGALDAGAGAMRELQRQVNTDTLDAVREKYDDVMDTHNEMEAAFAEPWNAGAAGVGDEAELSAELDALMEADLSADLIAPPPVAVAGAGRAAAAPAPAAAAVAAAATSSPTEALPTMPEVPTEKVVSPAPARAAPAQDMMAALAGLD